MFLKRQYRANTTENENQVKNEKTADLDVSTPMEVERENNHIYFYSEVEKNAILQLNKNIKIVGAEMLNMANVLEIPPPEIKLHINSPGGIILDGLAAVDAIRNSKVPVHSIVEGLTASAASLMSVMAHRRSINKHSYMLIHQLSGGVIGKFEEMVTEIDNSKSLMAIMEKIYLERTKIPEKVLKEIMKKDILLDAKQCLKYGLVDDIIE